MLARYAAEEDQDFFHKNTPSCAKAGIGFLKPLYDSIIQGYAQLVGRRKVWFDFQYCSHNKEKEIDFHASIRYT